MSVSKTLIHIVTAVALAMPLTAAAVEEYRVVIENHRFEPAEVKIPAGKRVILLVENRDATPEEFESHELKREKIIAGGKTAKIRIGPLKPGRYPFFGEFNEDTAQGAVIVE